MAKKKYDSSNGVWRTIGGRRVFIRTGQSLSDAMKESGKFKTKMNEKAVKGAREEDLKEQYKDSLNNVSKMEYNGEITKEEYDKAVKNINKAYIDKRNEYLKGRRTYEQVDKEWTDLAKKMEKDYDEFGTTNWQDEKRLNELSLERDTLSIKDDKFYTRKDGTKEYDPYKGTRFEKKYDSMEDALNDPNHPTRKYIDENLKVPRASGAKDFNEYELYKRAKENPDSIDPMTENSTDWEALDKKYSGRYKTEKIREQISQPVEYNYKSENLKEFSKRDIRDVSNEELKKYQEKMLNDDNYLQANRPNVYFNKMIKETPYIKTLEKHNLNYSDSEFKRAMLGRMESDINYYLGNGSGYAGHLWAKDEEEQINIMKALYNTLPEKEKPDWINEEKIEEYSKMMQKLKSSDLKTRFKSTYEYMKNNTTMSELEILEYLKKYKDKK